ncbi:hypothetical protein GGQ74_001897 [Desulfobaculum xiamenense]|uniref:Class III cytochrome C domain-containing protein n=1 Tax=Desulfobaculum xiamenense TaxID=995050 RepID=A0A846QSS3_9BACT|nr:cytochrome c3 family protein [Desulfobaculum xiamenense]NJB68224.1 hypothetical protein [Desulfobaculum xiamenense]
MSSMGMRGSARGTVDASLHVPVRAAWRGVAGVLVVLVCLLVPFCALSNTMPVARPDSVVVARPHGLRAQMPAVTFVHSRHGHMRCGLCHHTMESLGAAERCSSAGCHDMVAPHCPREKASGRYFKNAFHDSPASCRGCHAERSAEGHNAGPVACKGCHR